MTVESRVAATSYTATYGVVHTVLLDTAATARVTPGCLRLLLAVAERGGTVEGASHKLVGPLGSNATAIRRSSLELAHAGLVTNASKRGEGMRLALTRRGDEVASQMLGAIEALMPEGPV